MQYLEETLEKYLITRTYRAANDLHQASCKDKINHYQNLHFGSCEVEEQRKH